MSVEKYFALSGARQSKLSAEAAHGIPLTVMNKEFFDGCIYSESSWLTGPYRRDGLVRHDSDELMMFVGSNPDDTENLNAELELRIENDVLTLRNTCFVFIPAGVAHGDFAVKSLDRPVFRYSCHLNADTYTEAPAEATAAAGTYAGNAVERYAPVDGRMPTAPEGFLKLLLWIDGKKLKGAPYTEAVWFCTTNDTGPEEHDHDFDEFIGFFGSDPSKPGELGGEISFNIEGEYFSFTRDCLVYIPRGVKHSPILVPKMERPILHFSGGNGGDYKRGGSDQF